MSVYNGIVLINLGLTFVLFLMGTRMLIMANNINAELLKAQMFLKERLIRKMWVHSTVVGGFLIIHELSIAAEHFSYAKGLSEVTMTAFLIAFTLLTYIWYNLLKKSVKK